MNYSDISAKTLVELKIIKREKGATF